MKFQKRHAFTSIALVLLLLSGCGAWTKKLDGKEVALGERFKLSDEEKAFVKEAALMVQLKGVRRTWYVDGKSETAEAEILITLDREERQLWMGMGEKAALGDYEVELWAADPFGKTSCELIVVRRP
jgi:hypothetical protein